MKARIRRVFASLGLHEARSYPLGKGGDPDAVPLSNPLSADDAYLRSDLLAGLTRAAEHNWSVRQRDIRLFEIGTVFRRDLKAGRPQERVHLAAVVSGARTPPHWSTAGKQADYDLWDLKNLFEQAARLGDPQGKIVPDGAGWVLHDEAGKECGRAQRLEADQPAWAAGLFGLEVAISPAPLSREGEGAGVRHRALPVTPPVERDVALVVPAGVTAEQVEALMRRLGGSLLESAEVFDEYRSTELAGRSVAWRLVFRAPDRTLRDEEVDQIVARTLAALKEELNVRLRES